ncbi:MAG: hypothetical protein MJY97_01390 [Bacteroidales bacterium]|nr:hypothetical protein [Bacteroidales bacterium]
MDSPICSIPPFSEEMKKMKEKEVAEVRSFLEQDLSAEDMPLQIRKVQSTDGLVFPKVELPSISEADILRCDGCKTITAEDIENDERLAYILSR